ncbi:hypothetical protein IWW50_000202 [Coemansia erecta]|nr:hypothetical protein GGF43_000396 [Coemansia sp. RSA 2618]KAJ2830571.1 hypothetical protein IWW50_000202 [Coemansia erecta]
MQGSRSQQRNRNNNNNNNAASRSKRAAEPEEFPPLSDDSYSPPPYTVLDHVNVQSGSSSVTQSRPQLVTVTHGGEFRTTQLVSITQGEYYHPASFPGYTAVQLANGGEAQALLPRSTASIRRSAQGSQGRRRRTTTRRRRGLCGRLCSCLCLVVALMIVAVFASSVLYVARHVLPPSQDWQCASLEPHADRAFTFPLTAPLRIDSTDGLSISNVYVAQRNGTTGERGVHVRAVVEASRGNYVDRIDVGARTPDQDGSLDSLLYIRVVRPRWEWPRGCVRASLYVSIPEFLSDSSSSSPLKLLPSLHIATGTGVLHMLDAGNLAVNDVTVDMRNGAAYVRNVTVHGSLFVSTSNGRVNVTDVQAGSAVSIVSTNGALAVNRVQARGVTATTTNASVRVAGISVSESSVALRTTNAAISLREVTADRLSAVTSNAAIRGDAHIRTSADVQTSNGVVALEISGTTEQTTTGAVDGAERRSISVRSSNRMVELGLTGIEGLFDLVTSNARAVVAGDRDLIKMHHSSDTNKSGAFGRDNADGARISVSTSNAQALLRFAPQ